jgi:hypothetical protein
LPLPLQHDNHEIVCHKMIFAARERNCITFEALAKPSI